MNWFYSTKDEAKGPFSAENIVQLIKTGAISGETPIWRDPMPDWVRLDTQPEFADLVPVRTTPPPIPNAMRVPNAAQGMTPEAAPSNDGDKVKIAGPWTRFFARLIDGWVLGMVGTVFYFPVALLLPSPTVESEIVGYVINFTVIICILVVLCHFAILTSFGSTFGKMLLGIAIVPLNKLQLSARDLVAREFRVFFFGYGLFVPIISQITMINAALKLSKNGTTGYDAGRTRVVNNFATGGRNALMLIGMGIAYFAVTKIGEWLLLKMLVG